MAAPPIGPPRSSSATLLGGLFGGILGTSGMILVGLGAESTTGLSFNRLLPELELGFGGPIAGAGVLGSSFTLPIHYLHGIVLGLLFAGIWLLGERWALLPPIPVWASGMVFGAVVSAFVLGLLAGTVGDLLTPGVAGLVFLLHLTFGGLTGAAVQQFRRGSPPRAGWAPPA